MEEDTVKMLRTYRRNNRLALKHVRQCAAYIRNGEQEKALLEAMRAVARGRCADRASQYAQKMIFGGKANG